MSSPDVAQANFQQVKLDLMRRLHEVWFKWMRDGGWVGHRFVPRARLLYDKDGISEEIHCADCNFARSQHSYDMVPFERVTEARRDMYARMAEAAFVVGHEIGEESARISATMQATHYEWEKSLRKGDPWD